MEYFFSIGLIILFVFAVFDLIVGVSNDAVNFLNSAIGSKVASRNTIMIFASVGIFMGSFLSSGMMEVARKGIFDPAQFYLPDLFCVFIAVMICDIILLDLFNTLGLPTSTTISLVFSLLGSALSVALIKIASPLSQEPLHHLGNYIKSERTLTILSGIFLSIGISFITGMIVHYFVRWMFGFNYEKKLKYVGSLWAALALSSMTYFLIIEGFHSALKGLDPKEITGATASINDFLEWVDTHFYGFIGALFVTWLLIAQIFFSLSYNVLKFVVLFGTFSLAMAFAGNDLVNFIGVPMAGFESFQIWSTTGKPDAETFGMQALAGNVQSSPLMLLGAGIIMILTLWFSKKARTVTETEINLGRQDEGAEKFSSNSLARLIVRGFRGFGRFFFGLFPKRMLVKIERNFKQNQQNEDIAFDLVRASANLTISSILIAIATTHKLPLSTTFVTFMVAMGTSLSDRAWGRESAVYRVAGVLKIIGGWFLTGVIAFLMAGIFAGLLHEFREWALLGAIGLVFFSFYKNNKEHKKAELKKAREETHISGVDELSLFKALKKTSDRLALVMESVEQIYQKSIEGVCTENLKMLQKERKLQEELRENFTATQGAVIKVIKKTKANEPTTGKIYIEIYEEIQLIINALDIISQRSLDHVLNSHKPLKSKQKINIEYLKESMLEYIHLMRDVLETKKFHTYRTHSVKNIIINDINEQLNYQVMGIVNKKYGPKNSTLVFAILLKSKDLLEAFEKILQLYNKISREFPLTEIAFKKSFSKHSEKQNS
ncbi:inorganic phosphate transporter [Bacteroidetes bacterium endosymbiont of Geopemphigus sp.]|uniref:inorganic phosphate transporter n=1 Tax=Bacteroidetes bacterium endosymbiont of Geopemphigus sp. TaxID=2047937 RepID=UPI000CD204AC|nr:inorganic phosphate transporter [Bacteroidetes bacterium endosymbiont of Geopemphigus sp.]